MEANSHYDAIVLGAGPAGLTAGIYLSRAKLKTLILDEGTIGGQMVLTHEIANYPGVESISGYQLANIMKKQAKNFGCVIKSNISVQRIELEDEVKSISLSDGNTFTSNSIISKGKGSPIVPHAMVIFLLIRKLLWLEVEIQRLRKRFLLPNMPAR